MCEVFTCLYNYINVYIHFKKSVFEKCKIILKHPFKRKRKIMQFIQITKDKI